MAIGRDCRLILSTLWYCELDRYLLIGSRFNNVNMGNAIGEMVIYLFELHASVTIVVMLLRFPLIYIFITIQS